MLSDNPTIALQRYGQHLYDGLILFSPTAERFGGSLDVAAILDFVDSGKDLIVAADVTASVLIRNVAAECGIDFDEAPLLFKGIGHSLNPANSLVLKALSASPSAYSANPKSKLSSPPSLSGSFISLVSVVHARNNARVVFSGSLDLFSNKFFKSLVQKAGTENKLSMLDTTELARLTNLLSTGSMITWSTR